MTDPITTPAQMREAAALLATSFLVGDPKNGVPLRNPMAHEIAAAIRALPVAERQKPLAVKVKPRIFMLPDGRAGVCVGGRYDGWMMYRHLDGQWVTDHKMPVSDPSESLPAALAALDVSETPESERQTYLLSASERQEIRDRALEDAAQCCADEADRCEDTVKWGGHRRYIQDCKAAAYAMMDRAIAIRAMKGTKG